MSNSINTLSPDFRDFLLLKNLVADTIVENGLSSLLGNIGYPAPIDTQPISVQQGQGVSIPGQLYQQDNTILNKYQGSVNDYTQTNIIYNNSSITNQTGPYSFSQTNVANIGNEFRPENTKFNLYIDEDKQTLVNLNTVSIPTVDNFTSYLDENGNLNVGGPSTQALDILSGALNGQGVGFNVTDGTFISNGDIRATLGGRILGAAGIINDTKLGKIGAQQLLTHVGYNAAFGLQQETLGNINLNPLTLLQGAPLVTLNYQITTPKNTVGKVLNFAANIFGVQSPLSLLQDSIFSFDDKGIFIGNENIKMANEMIKNSGRGQVNSLFNNLRANTRIDTNIDGGVLRQGYAPGYEDDRGGANDGINPQIYARTNGDGKLIDFINGATNNPISSGNYERSEQIKLDGWNKDYIDKPHFNTPKGIMYKDAYGWQGPNIANKDDIPNSDGDSNAIGLGDLFTNPTQTDRKTLLFKTQQLFNTGLMRTMVSGHGDIPSEGRSQINSAVSNVGGYTSKGSGVMSSSAVIDNVNNGPENVFCRTWTTYDRYAQVKDLQKSSGLGTVYNDYDRLNTFSSVLDDNGFVKITPYSNVGNDDIKNYMFSIENLAWADSLNNLLPCEIGPGDPVSGLRGRIMWFPPYDISFTETTNASWDKHNFIGRGEPMFTYNNTERTGTLQWKIIIDHPNYINLFENDSRVNNDFIASFFAGCLSLEQMEPFLTKAEFEETVIENQPEKEEKVDEPITPPTSFNVYFPNDTASVEGSYDGYEDGKIRECSEGVDEVKFIRDSNGRVIEIDYGLYADGTPNKETLNPPGDPEYFNTPGTYLWYLNEYEFEQGKYNQLKNDGYFIDLPFTVGINYFVGDAEVSEFNEFNFYDCDLGFDGGETLNRFNEYNNMVNLGYISLMPFNVHIPYSTSGFEVLNSGTTAPFISEFTYYADVLNIDEQVILDTYNNLYAPPLLPPNDYPWVEFLIFNGEPGNSFVPHCWKLEVEENNCNINSEDNPTGEGNGIAAFPDVYNEECFKYKNNKGTEVWSSARCRVTSGSEGREQPDRTNFGLNNKPVKIGDKEYKNWKDPEYHKDLRDLMVNQSKSLTINILGYASAVGGKERNLELSKRRAEYIKNYIKENVLNGLSEDEINKRLKIVSKGEGQTSSAGDCKTSPNDVTDDGKLIDVKGSLNDTEGCKANRYVSVEFVDDIELKSEIEDEKKLDSQEGNLRVPNIPLSRFYSECDYFEKLSQDDPIVYSEIKQKIKYFQPSFHSTTPEGFNSRLNFLQQCMRQGPTVSVADNGDNKAIPGTPDNLAFGRPPVCILRLGDFYYTRIIIDSISFSYDPLVWDLNPEGVGVQPMICTVDMSFNFIGGSSLNGPISKLQNAVSFNYYANTEIYDRRSDTIGDNGDGTGYIIDGLKNINPDGSTTRPFFKPDKNQTIQTSNEQEIKSTPASGSNDEAIFRDALDKFLFNININYNYEQPNDLGFFDGSFGLTNENFQSLSKDYDATVVLYTKNGYTDLVNFKIGGKDSDGGAPGEQLIVPGGGRFTSDNKNWEPIFDDAVIDKNTGEIVFGVKINEFNIVLSDIFIKPPFDCPNEFIYKSSIQTLSLWSSIYENVCVNCFSGSTTQPPTFLNC